MIAPQIVNWLRRAELVDVIPFVPKGAKILEIGAGSGQQSFELSKLGDEVVAIDISSSDYADARVFPVTDYDGITISLSDDFFGADWPIARRRRLAGLLGGSTHLFVVRPAR